MNGDDARIARVYTTPPGGVTEDTSPNAGPPRTTTFDLILQLEAGHTVGSSGGAYDLFITAINDDTGGAVAGLAPPGSPFLAQHFDPPPPPAAGQTETAGSGWEVGSPLAPAGTGDFVLTSPRVPPPPAAVSATTVPRILGIMRFSITIPAGPPVLTGQFHYNVRFVNVNREIVNLAQSNPFVLV
jgi:hypothetical protein